MKYTSIAICLATSMALYGEPEKTHSFTEYIVNVTEKVFHEVGHLEQLAEHALKDAGHEVTTLVKTYVHSLGARYAIEQPDSFSYTQSSISSSPQEEQSVLAARKEKAKHALISALNLDTLEEIPTVAFCGSGGGVRACCETLGWLSAADSMELLDTIQYASGLSGSTWALNPWVASKMSPKEYREHLVPVLTHPLTEHIKTMTTKELYDVILTLGRTYYTKKEITVIDLYGTLLSHLFLRTIPNLKNPYQLSLSSLRPLVEAGTYPFILSTAVLGMNEHVLATFGHRPTYEFSVCTFGSFELNSFSPIWSLGRLYNKGTSQPRTTAALFPELSFLKQAATSYAPNLVGNVTRLYDTLEHIEEANYYGQEVPLGYLMGICGSAFSVDVYDALLELFQLLHPANIAEGEEKSVALMITLLQQELNKALGELGKKLSFGSAQKISETLNDSSFAAAKLPNISYHVNNVQLNSLENISLVDGGYELIGLDRLNIGIVPLLYRNVDLIFICDSSADYIGAPSLRAAEKIARKLALPFPTVSYESIDSKHATLIQDEDPSVPIIVYMPTLQNEEFSKQRGRTVNPHAAWYDAEHLTYTKEQAEDLVALTEFNVIQSKDTLMQALQLAVTRKNLRSRS